MDCKVCGVSFKDILKHLRKNEICAEEYDLSDIVLQRKLKRLEKKKIRSREKYAIEKNIKKEYYKVNKSSIRDKQADYKKSKKDDIKVYMARYYSKNRSQYAQKKRFLKHFKEKDAMKYITSHQEHLFLHTEGFCQPESMQSLNHSIEYYDGVCKFCTESLGVKIIGVNRQVCVNCKKAECVICKSEVSPDPEMGCFHYSPDSGRLLSFIPDYCPLYSNPFFPRFQATNHHKNQKDCKICCIIKKNYPEYEILCHLEKKSELREDMWIYEDQEMQIYSCNLCDSNFKHVCEFDLHMRSHTKHGKNVAIIAIGMSLRITKFFFYKNLLSK